MAGGPHHGEDGDIPEPPRLRQLRLLVNTLTITLIVGFAIIVATLVIRMTGAPASVGLPAEIALPEGETAGAVTLGAGWVALVTIDTDGTERIRVFDRETGEPRAETVVIE